MPCGLSTSAGGARGASACAETSRSLHECLPLGFIHEPHLLDADPEAEVLALRLLAELDHMSKGGFADGDRMVGGFGGILWLTDRAQTPHMMLQVTKGAGT